MSRYLFFFIIFLTSHLMGIEPLSYLGMQLQKAKEGDYIVTQQSGNYSLLYVQFCENRRLLLQEISIPEPLVNPKKIDWQKWLSDDAPGHTSWIIFEIDLQEGQMLESYDTGKGEWLHLASEDHLLMKLLHIPMRLLPEQERRRIGPPPLDGDSDHRAVWNPPQVLENSSGKNQTAAWRAKWPSDQSPLSGCRLDLYYDSRNNDFPFPVSIDIQSNHYKAHMRVVKAGKHMQGISQRMPRRPPRFLSPLSPSGTDYQVSLSRPSYYKNFQLLALSADEMPISLPYQASPGKNSEELILKLTRKELEPLLKKGHRYRLAFVSAPSTEGYAEAEGSFLWP